MSDSEFLKPPFGFFEGQFVLAGVDLRNQFVLADVEFGAAHGKAGAHELDFVLALENLQFDLTFPEVLSGDLDVEKRVFKKYAALGIIKLGD